MKKETGAVAVKKSFINIEGREYPWTKETITVSELKLVGRLPSRQQVVEEFPNGTERTLADDQMIQLKPGHRYGRAPKFKRG
jgi:hypothetical protein